MKKTRSNRQMRWNSLNMSLYYKVGWPFTDETPEKAILDNKKN